MLLLDTAAATTGTATDTGGLFGGGYTMIIMLVLFIGIFYFMILRPENKKKKEQEALRPRTVVFSSPDHTAGHCQPTLLPETPGHSQASLAQSLVESLLLSPGSWCTQDFFVPSKSLFLQSCGSSVIKSYWLPRLNSLGVLSPFTRSPGWEICCGS